MHGKQIFNKRFETTGQKVADNVLQRLEEIQIEMQKIGIQFKPSTVGQTITLTARLNEMVAIEFQFTQRNKTIKALNMHSLKKANSTMKKFLLQPGFRIKEESDVAP